MFTLDYKSHLTTSPPNFPKGFFFVRSLVLPFERSFASLVCSVVSHVLPGSPCYSCRAISMF